MTDNDIFPEGMNPLGNTPFAFSCHSGVSCYMTCCKNVDMFLYPYDIIRLKNCLKISSEQFMRKFTRLAKGSHPYFPAIMLKLSDNLKQCPFLCESGCTVYHDRPSSCRMYPLERAVNRNKEKDKEKEFYFLTNHDYCKGHFEDKSFTVKQWIRDQNLIEYNLMDDLWTEMDTLFSTNPWKGEGSGGEKQQLAFMVCYNIDQFREMISIHRLLDRYKLSRDQKKRIKRQDHELLKFGYQWLQLILTGKSSLISI